MKQKGFLTHKEEISLKTTKTNECPVCHKIFDMADDSKYLINNKYTCSWECFSSYVKTHPKCKK